MMRAISQNLAPSTPTHALPLEHTQLHRLLLILDTQLLEQPLPPQRLLVKDVGHGLDQHPRATHGTDALDSLERESGQAGDLEAEYT